MYIDKSFQLLSADNGKLAPDETRRQDPAEGDAEFSDLFGAELDSQEQQNATGTDKKSGQEVAAFVTPQGSTAEQLLKEQILSEKSLVDKNLPGNLGNGQAAGDDSSLSGGDVVTQNAATLTAHAAAADEDNSQAVMEEMGAEHAAKQNPWLAIINQSHDFNAILSQTTPGGSANETVLTKTETLVAELLGLPVAEHENIAAHPSDSKLGLDATLSSKVDGSTETSAKAAELSGKSAAENIVQHTSLSDPALQKLAAGHASDNLPAESQKTGAEVGSKGRVINDKMTTLPAEQVSLQQQFKTEQPHASNNSIANVMPDAAGSTAENAKQDQLVNSNSTVANAAGGQTSQLQVSAESVAGQLNQADNKAQKSSATSPVEIDLPIAVNPDEKSVAAAVTMTAAATPQAKNAPQSFAQFQKSANAAAALVQKQQLQAEQVQSQPLQDLAVQQTQRVAEFNQSLPGNHTDTPVTLTTLLQTDRPISAGSAMGSSTGQQQQQAASQLFATKLNDQITSNEQPPLNLLEPSAAAQLKERVMFQVNQKIQSAEIRLAPEELGSMQIKVQMQQEQLSVQFVVQQAGAKEALEQQMPRLREMLEEQGIELTQGQVSQQREGSADQRSTRERNQGLDQGPDTGDEPLQQQAIVRVSDRMVDYYA